MIQRIQSVYLFIAAVVGLIMFLVPLATECEDGKSMEVVDYYPAFISLIISCVLSLAALIVYKNRRLQMKICVIAMIVFLLTFVLSSYVAAARSCNVGFGAVIPLLSAVLVFLARNSINKDEKLVRSADRLR